MQKRSINMSSVRVVLLAASLIAPFLFSFLVVEAQITDPSEVDALRAIRRSLLDPQKFLNNWGKGDPCMRNWTGISCSEQPLNDGYLHVQELHLLNMNLSGVLDPELGQLFHLKILDFMWNSISGSIPKEIGNLTSLQLLLLNGNQLTGVLPEELGYLHNLDRLQIDENHISGPLPKSFANLNKTRHFHMNNNSISGQIPSELSRLPSLIHLLLDNNNLSGFLPPELSEFPRLRILQLDNNNFDGTEIPASYANMSKLLKLSLRNCSLRGSIPDISMIPKLGYLDLSWNQLSGTILLGKLSENITTIDLSHNNLTGSIPTSFSGLPFLQKLSLESNLLNGSVSSAIWGTVIVGGAKRLVLNFRNNFISEISGALDPPANVSLMLQGNPVCSNANTLNIVQFCGSQELADIPESTKPEPVCPIPACPVEENFGYVLESTGQCFCAAPVRVGYRLKSPLFSSFPPHMDRFEVYLSASLQLALYQLEIVSFMWEEGPRLKMYLKFYPPFFNESGKFSRLFNDTEIKRIRGMFTRWTIPADDFFGPHEFLNFTLLPPYNTELFDSTSSGMRKGAIVGIVLGSIGGALAVFALISVLLMRRHSKNRDLISRRSRESRVPVKMNGVRSFSFREMELATNNFSSSIQVGQGGYGKVFKGILADGRIVAIKRAREGSLQGEKEFYTEIELLSRLHHRNLVSLIGYCDEQGEQMLVYEFMPNGSLQDLLSALSKECLSFATRLQIALASAKGILYLHTEADPPVFHRDIKTSNILLDSKFTAKVADFGISRLAPVEDGIGAIPGHVSTVVKGSPGYLDPEYFLTHKLTDKSDVYSLGVVFLELLTGLQPISRGKNIVREVNMAFHSGAIFSVVDGRMGSYPSECVERFVKLALNCCQDESDGRPSMADVVKELESMWRLLSDSDRGLLTPATPVSRKSSGGSPARSVSLHPFVSTDASGSDLVSGVIPAIKPR